MVSYLLILCTDCGEYRRVHFSLDELRCDKCQMPVAFLRDPGESHRRLRREMAQPLER